jgi:hypothetical protein
VTPLGSAQWVASVAPEVRRRKPRAPVKDGFFGIVVHAGDLDESRAFSVEVTRNRIVRISIGIDARADVVFWLRDDVAMAMLVLRDRLAAERALSSGGVRLTGRNIEVAGTVRHWLVVSEDDEVHQVVRDLAN